MIKKIKIMLVVFLVIVLTYGIAWVQMYISSEKFYKDAVESYNNKDYAIAIKGKKVENQDESGYVFKGGFEQAADTWSGTYAFPKPKVYYDSTKMINDIINNKLDVKSGTDMFNRYFKLDKGYLDAVLLRVADLYIKDDDKDDAVETLKLVQEAFPNNADIQQIVNDKLQKLK